jgi:hypothetical protein
MTMAKRWMILTIVMIVVVLAVTALALRSSVREATAIATETMATTAKTAGGTTTAGLSAPAASTDGGAVTIVSLDGTQTFTVPEPGDPEWEDYQEMLQHRQFRSVLRNSSGYGLPYDPEWRSVITGRREAPPIDAELSGGMSSLTALANAVVAAIVAEDRKRLQALRITPAEFETIFWPEFPQSRPYVRIPVAEAWGFHLAKCLGGVGRALQDFGGRQLELIDVSYGSTKEYTNFVLYEDVTLHTLDPESHERVDLGVVPTLAKRNGRFKVFIYRD